MKKISFVSDSFLLEALLDEGYQQHKGVVITHPYPLLGGDMYNIVVETIAAVYKQKGYTTLRPNFRGTGNSQGVYNNGAGESRDVLAALSWLVEKGFTAIDLAGYSFGSWVNVQTATGDVPLQNRVMVSPPVDLFKFPDQALPALSLVVSGDSDQYGCSESVRRMMPVWNPHAHFEIMPGCDHFYSGYLDDLRMILSRYIG